MNQNNGKVGKWWNSNFYFMEEWKDIVWYEWIYQVSNLWRVMSLKFWKKKILKTWIRKWWYSTVIFSNNKNKKTFIVSRLVGIYFVDNPYNLPFACHKREELVNWKLDDSASNIWWWTAEDNARDKIWKWREYTVFRINHPVRWKFWIDHHRSKKILQFSKENIFIKEWDSIADIERELWVSHIVHCCKWNRKTAWWFIWKYKE